ncbi:MAG: ABC transporter ATP-binding protein [Chitinophagaceae bacterium]
MQIELTGAGKRFNREWIFRKADLQFNAGVAYAITGHNGSGKSTLLQSIGGMLQLSEGKILFHQNGNTLADEKVYQQISFCAPYFDVIEEMTLVEFLEFHSQFKSFINGLSIQAIIDIIDLQAAAQKQIRFYSSGMKQRVKLAQAILSDTAVVLLDEPCSNLDAKGIALYHSLIKNYCADRIVIVCSNDEVEYSFCEVKIEMQQFK